MKTINNTYKLATKIAGWEDLSLEHLTLVKVIALRVLKNLPGNTDLNDLIRAGIGGLYDAARNYGDRQVPFESYAKSFIRGAILDSLNNRTSIRQEPPGAICRELSSALYRTRPDCEPPATRV
jgi:DNA-directed RNA polymerase specialized sigma subunit